MKAFALLLFAVAPLGACSDRAEQSNRAGAGAGTDAPAAAAAENRAADEAAGAAAAAAAPGGRDVPSAGSERSRPAEPPDADGADACGASRYQWLVGRPRSAIPARPAGATWRIACTGCPITMDYSAERMNIFYDAETERIEEVGCG